MPSKFNEMKPDAGTLQSAAVTTLSLAQLVACFKLLPATSTWNLAAQIVSLAGLYVGTRWSIENYLEGRKNPVATPVAVPEVIRPAAAPVPVAAPVAAPAIAPAIAPAPITTARAIQNGRTRGFTMHMLDDVINAEPQLIPLKDRKPITTINLESFGFDPINAFKSDQVFITKSNYALVVNEYAQYLISAERFDNPYTREPLEKTDIAKLLEHQVIKDTVSLYRIPTDKRPQKHSQRHNAQYHRR